MRSFCCRVSKSRTVLSLNHSQNGAQFPDERPSTFTISSMSLSLRSPGATIARAAISTQPSSPNGGLAPVFVVLICAGILAATSISLCMWRRLLSGEDFHPLSAYSLIPRGRKNHGDPAHGRPEMFDAWTERCNPNSLKWEEYMVSKTPFVPRVGVHRRFRCNISPVLAFFHNGRSKAHLDLPVVVGSPEVGKIRG
ncbi:hypothetical protein BJY52DRAFT_1287027, partial [Lactarius psammicola]